jgi:hypothetical protein
MLPFPYIAFLEPEENYVMHENNAQYLRRK